MRPEVPVVKFTGSPGRIDLVNILTGECWEIKPYHSENMGNDQLANYVHGHFVNPNLVKGNKLKRGGFIAPGVFEDQTARVYYWYAGRGIILYVYSKKIIVPQPSPEAIRETVPVTRPYSYAYSPDYIYNDQHALSDYAIMAGIVIILIGIFTDGAGFALLAL